MSDRPEVTPEVEAAFVAAATDAPAFEAPAEEAPVEDNAPEVEVNEPDYKSEVDHLKKKLGDQGNELGELRRWKAEVEAAKAADPANEEAQFEQWMQRWDPDFKDLKEADGYVRDRSVMYNMAKDVFAYVHEIRDQMRAEIGGLSTKSELERLGITEDSLREMVADPAIGGLWEKASPEERMVLAQRLAAPSQGGPTTIKPNRASVPDPSVSGVPNSGRASGEEVALRAIADGKLDKAKSYIDDLLDRSLVGVQGAVVNPGARRR